MKRAAGLSLALSSSVLAAPAVEVKAVTEAALAKLVRGDLLLVGDTFGGKTFQDAVLAAMRKKTVRVRVLTSPAFLNHFAPVKRLGGEVRTLKGLTGRLAVLSDALIVQETNTYKLVRGEGVAAGVLAQLDAAWRLAR